jgi:hypothetical protein
VSETEFIALVDHMLANTRRGLSKSDVETIREWRTLVDTEAAVSAD